jgi:pSer/pThr/pTyr-binding forkhead associated (FHA) protein
MDDDDDASTVLLSGEDTLLQSVSIHEQRVYITRVKNQQKMEIAKPMFKIGRSADSADFYVAGNGMVGREHAFIIKDGGSVYIKDNNSKNHTYVNDVMVTAGEKVELKNQDIIRIADEAFEISIQ